MREDGPASSDRGRPHHLTLVELSGSTTRLWTFPALLALLGLPAGSLVSVADQDWRTGALTVLLLAAVSGAWAGYCVAVPCRVSYRVTRTGLVAFRGTSPVRSVPVHDIVDIDWGLASFDWRGMFASYGVPSMPKLLVVTKVQDGGSHRVWLPSICVWGERPQEQFLLDAEAVLREGSSFEGPP